MTEILIMIIGVIGLIGIYNNWISSPFEKDVNCVFLRPAKKSINRPHCNMGDGREGDCPVYLGKIRRCIYQISNG